MVELTGGNSPGANIAAAANHWGNADLIPGVRVDTNAMVRVTQLEQDGFTLIYE